MIDSKWGVMIISLFNVLGHGIQRAVIFCNKHPHFMLLMIAVVLPSQTSAQQLLYSCKPNIISKARNNKTELFMSTRNSPPYGYYTIQYKASPIILTVSNIVNISTDSGVIANSLEENIGLYANTAYGIRYPNGSSIGGIEGGPSVLKYQQSPSGVINIVSFSPYSGYHSVSPRQISNDTVGLQPAGEVNQSYPGYGVLGTEYVEHTVPTWCTNSTDPTSCVDVENNSNPQIVSIPSAPQINEYSPSSFTLTATVNSLPFRVTYDGSRFVCSGSAGCGPDYNLLAVPGVINYECSLPALNLNLTLDQTSIDFGDVTIGSSALTRPLTWSANGSGQAPQWTMAFDSVNKDGDKLLLGGAKISVLDGVGHQVPLGTAVNIHGVTGLYTFQLDPTDASSGSYRNDVNITLTAN